LGQKVCGQGKSGARRAGQEDHGVGGKSTKYSKASSYGVPKYVKDLEFDRKTGEVLKEKNRQYSAGKIIECLNKISCSNEQDNLYRFDYRSEISDAIGSALKIDFTRKILQLAEVKNILANSKK
jgi:hypothetical protein